MTGRPLLWTLIIASCLVVIEAQGNKPGRCPLREWNYNSTDPNCPANQCDTDQDCERETLCCPNGCSSECVQPEYEALLCENSGQLPLLCPDDRLIRITDAFWGRDDHNTTCSHDTAVGGDPCSFGTELDILRQMCDGRTECNVDARSEFFGDPCPGSYKYLRVNYTCLDCVNVHNDDTQCEFWRQFGQCENDPIWMFKNCRKACWGICDVTPPACENVYGVDEDCQFWEAIGQCELNPVWMHTYCRKACLNCDGRTDCSVNAIDAIQDTQDCPAWYDDTQCELNSGFMLPFCRRSCFECSSDVSHITCSNKHDNDTQCQEWADNSQCDINPGFMVPMCLKTCLGCTEDPVCTNILPDDECVERQQVGECVTNATDMYRDCWKTCTNCRGTPECVNRHGNDIECDIWTILGECEENPGYMMTECTLSCTRCGLSVQQEKECTNLYPSDDDCNVWAIAGDCHTNPNWMFSYCRKSCSLCHLTEDTLKLLGALPVPGITSSFTSRITTLLPDEFESTVRITHFVAYFVTTSPILIQVWRKTTSSSYTTIYSQLVTPDIAAAQQTVVPRMCVLVQKGDRIGFTNSLSDPAPLGMIIDGAYARKKTSYRGFNSRGRFRDRGFPFRFSLAAAYDEVNLC